MLEDDGAIAGRAMCVLPNPLDLAGSDDKGAILDRVPAARNKQVAPQSEVRIRLAGGFVDVLNRRWAAAHAGRVMGDAHAETE